MGAYELVEMKTEIFFYGHNIIVETADKCRNEEEGLLEAVEAVKLGSLMEKRNLWRSAAGGRGKIII